MLPHGRTHSRKKHKTHDIQSPEEMLLPRVDDPTMLDSYSRSHHHNSHRTDNYRTSSSSRRSGHNVSSASSSRSHPEEDWRSGGGRRYDYPPAEDAYRPTREDFGTTSGRESDVWGKGEMPYSRDEWQGYGAYPYPESTSWNPSMHGAYRDRSAAAYDWAPEANRIDSRAKSSGIRNRYPVPTSSTSYKHTNDNGWQSRQTSRSHYEPSTPAPTQDAFMEDRSWEPAPGWKEPSRTDEQTSRTNGNSMTQRPSSSKNNKKHQNQSRKWFKRTDSNEGDLNNWQRRDVNMFTQYPPGNNSRNDQYNHRYSPSKSPCESTYSHYSSKEKSRSRSRSPVPKRQRRDDYNRSTPNISSSDKAHAKYGSYGDQRLESPHYRDTDRHRRSPSLSTRSSRASISPSPEPSSRRVHRLPGSTTDTTSSVFEKVSPSSGLQRPKNIKNGKNKRKKSKDVHSAANQAIPAPNAVSNIPSRPAISPVSIRRPTPPAASAIASPVLLHQMPLLPPKPSFPAKPVLPVVAPVPEPPSQIVIPAPEPIKNGIGKVVVKRAGFKPIGLAKESSLRKFFPGDDDEEMEGVTNARTKPTPTAIVEAPQPDPRGDSGINTVAEQASLDMPPPRVKVEESAPESIIEEMQASNEHDQTNNSHTESNPQTIVRSGRTRDLYCILSQVGEGTFGKVYKAVNTVSNQNVALKRIRMEGEKDGFPVTAMREIKLLQSLRHENVVQLYEMMVSNGSVYMVFEYMDHDLTGILSQNQFIFTEAHLKSMCLQMLSGLAYLHHKGVIHRDIKGSNILLNNRGEIKLADFGLARFYQKRRRADYTNRVITLWYRPPELLLGATVYGPEVDMWSAGCIMLELFTKRQVFRGNDEIHQLDVIYSIFGTPTAECWPEISSLPWYELVKPKETLPNRFRELFQRWMPPDALDLAELLLTYNPALRSTAAQAMQSQYFQKDPLPERPTSLSTLEGEWHELESKRERAKKKKKTDAA